MNTSIHCMLLLHILCLATLSSANGQGVPSKSEPEVGIHETAVGDRVVIQLLHESSAKIQDALGFPKTTTIAIIPIVGTVKRVGPDGTVDIDCVYRCRAFTRESNQGVDLDRIATISAHISTDELKKSSHADNDRNREILRRTIGNDEFASLKPSTRSVQILSANSIEFKIWRPAADVKK